MVAYTCSSHAIDLIVVLEIYRLFIVLINIATKTTTEIIIIIIIIIIIMGEKSSFLLSYYI